MILARRRMSAAELARRAGMKQPYLSRRMTGEIAFDLDDIEAIAAALGVTVQDLIYPQGSDRPSAIARYLEMPGRTTKQQGVPAHNRPPGQTGSTRPQSIRRTARLPRDGHPKQA